MTEPLTRRNLLSRAAAAPFLATARAAGAKPTLCIFSKHLQQFGYDKLAGVVRDFGFDGVDLTVRPRGHVLPENVARDLPRAVKALRGRGLKVPMISTGLTSAKDPAAEPTLRAASRLKVPFFKIGYTHYGNAPLFETLAATTVATDGLVDLARRYGITAGFHNHSGNYVGAVVWDTREMIRDMDPRWIGYYFDPCHATIEGGSFGWQAALDVALPRLKMVAIKDFYWKREPNGKWRRTMCPLGQGMVDWDRFFATIAKAQFTGPISLHLEYKTEDEMKAIATDFAFLRRMVGKHYG